MKEIQSEITVDTEYDWQTEEASEFVHRELTPANKWTLFGWQVKHCLPTYFCIFTFYSYHAFHLKYMQ